MSDAEIEMEQKREEDERLDTAEDPNEEVRHSSTSTTASDSSRLPFSLEIPSFDLFCR